MLAFILLLGSVFLSRTINDKANQHLNQNQKADLVDLFSGSRPYTFGALVLILLGYFAGIKFSLLDPFLLSVLYCIAMLAFIISVSISAYKKLIANDFPSHYIKSYITSTAVRFIGMLLFFVLLWR